MEVEVEEFQGFIFILEIACSECSKNSVYVGLTAWLDSNKLD